MADELVDSTVADGATTPAPAETVETQTAPETTTTTEAPATPSTKDEPRTADDVWDSMIEESEPDEKAETTAEKPVKEEGKAEAKQDEKKEDPAAEKTAEEEALEAAFADESEKKPEESEEDVAKMTEAEMLERQRNKYAREWADRNAKKAETLKRFQYEDTPIAEVATELEGISKERYEEFSQYAAHKLVDANPDATFQRAYAVKMLQKDPKWDVANAKYPSLDDLIANGGAQGTVHSTPSTPPTTSAPAELRDLTGELDSTLGWDWRNPELDDNFVDERELAMAKTIRALEAKAAEGSTQAKELEERLKGMTETQTSVEQQELEGELRKEVNEFRGELERSTLPYIAKSTGLEITADDTPEIKAFKENRMVLFTGTEYERANNIPSQFESYAYNESTVRNELETITKRIVAASIKKVQARRSDDKAGVDKYAREIADEKLPMSQLLGQATKEFKAKFIAPDLALIGKLSAKFSEPIKEASERVEVVSNGSSVGASRPQKKTYQTADDVWGGMVEDAEAEDRLRAGA